MITHSHLLESRVEVYPDLLWYWNAWCELSMSRPPAFSGCARIPFEALAAYCAVCGVTRDSQRENLRTAVRILDDELIAIEDEDERRRERARETERRVHG